MSVIPVQSNYGSLGAQLAAGNINFSGGTIKVMVVTSSYTPNLDTHVHKSDLTNEIAATSPYVAGGVTLGSKTVTYMGSGLTQFDAADVTSWSAGIPLGRYGVVYLSTGTDSTSPLISLLDFQIDIQLTGIQWDTTGVFQVQV